MNETISITGMGIVSSIGHNIREFNAALKKGISNIGYLEDTSDGTTPGMVGAAVKWDGVEKTLDRMVQDGICPRQINKNVYQMLRRGPEPAAWAVISALQAWEQAKIIGVPPERIGIVVAGNNLSPKLSYQLYEKCHQAPEFIPARYALNYLDTNLIGMISETLQIHGESFCAGATSASGNIGIIKGYQMIQLGLLDICLVVGAATDLSMLELQAFCQAGAMGGKEYYHSPQQACRPFDRRHEGFIYGQAAACLIIESSESARKRGAAEYGQVLGGAVVLDGNHLANPNVNGEKNAITLALARAGVTIDQIDYINAHGTASIIGDETEAQAIEEVFQGYLEHLWVNSTKGLTGHCLSSAGVVEAVAVILQMKENFLHPSLNLDDPISHKINFAGNCSMEKNITYAVSNSFAFGGINSSIVLKKGANIDE